MFDTFGKKAAGAVVAAVAAIGGGVAMAEAVDEPRSSEQRRDVVNGRDAPRGAGANEVGVDRKEPRPAIGVGDVTAAKGAVESNGIGEHVSAYAREHRGDGVADYVHSLQDQRTPTQVARPEVDGGASTTGRKDHVRRDREANSPDNAKKASDAAGRPNGAGKRGG